jgi:hydroxymethylbilane synthase
LNRTLRIGTRGSKLALAQSGWIRDCLQRRHPDLSIEMVVIKTTGDRFVDQPLSELGGKGVFVKEIEEAMLAGTIDCAVHSMKDVPSELAPGLVIAATPPREDPRDLLIARDHVGFSALRPGARVGTSSLRRMALLRASRSDLEVHSLRGNVDTRLGKLDRGEFDAIVLAAAGLRRLGIERPDGVPFDPEDFVPAIGQGVLALESRADATVAVLAVLDDTSTRIAVNAERAFLLRVGGSCRTPLAAYATADGGTITVRALIADPDGTRVLRGTHTGASADAAAIGTALADELLGRGGTDILRALDEQSGTRNGG